MRRHRALAPLSREHHFALRLAGRLQKKRCLPQASSIEPTTTELVEQVRAAFAGELDRHFALEEDVVIPRVYGRDIELDALCTDVVRQHAEMRAMALEVQAASLSDDARDEILARLGDVLEEHVRHEERLVFPRIEAVLDDSALAALAERTSAASE